MDVHTTLTEAQVIETFHATGLAARGLFLDTERGGSRTHDNKVSVRLYALDARPEYGAIRRTADNVNYGATWGEWGVFLAAIFKADESARCGNAKSPTYADAADFDAQTLGVFRGVAEFDQKANLTIREARTLKSLAA